MVGSTETGAFRAILPKIPRRVAAFANHKETPGPLAAVYTNKTNYPKHRDKTEATNDRGTSTFNTFATGFAREPNQTQLNPSAPIKKLGTKSSV